MGERLRFYWVVAACGAVVMALEILGSRLLAPHFGNSVYVWGSIISVFLAALSLGYVWGGRLADRHPRLPVLGRLITFGAVCQAVLLFLGPSLVENLARLTGSSAAGPLLASAVLFGPASVLLATVSPYAVRIAARDFDRLGATAGGLFALSSFGSLAGTLGCTFVLIPNLDLPQGLALLTALTAATALVALAGEIRDEVPVAVLAGLLILFAIPGSSRSRASSSDLIYERVTPYQTLRVREREGLRFLESDRILQAGVRLSDGEPALPYVRYAPAVLLLNPEVDRLLALGLGGGTVGRYLQKRLPGLEVDYVDIDPVIPQVARRHLQFRDGPGTRTRVTVMDGRRFLRESTRSWDVIYCDTYIGLSVPFHLTTVEFLDEVKRHLEPGGVFALNLAAGLEDPFSRAMYRTVVDRFASAYVFRVRGTGNALVMATEADSLSHQELLSRARQLDARYDFEPPLAAVVAGHVEVDLDASEVEVLTDDYAPVDSLIRLGEEDRLRSSRQP
ncbi:MAG TPA: fused MFS/spermidine synthase [Thermoanaerobaculia bacterium]|nr:fused MFS/spermidine synthase [Thermoanaerobaculia bacterium]